MSYTSVTEHFQRTMDGRGLRVSAVYLGGQKLGIKGSRSEVERAVILIRQIYTLSSFTELDDGQAAAFFVVPSECDARERYAEAVERMTVKRPDLFGNVKDTYQTEAELNGWRVKQGSLL